MLEHLHTNICQVIAKILLKMNEKVIERIIWLLLKKHYLFHIKYLGQYLYYFKSQYFFSSWKYLKSADWFASFPHFSGVNGMARNKYGSEWNFLFDAI